jgi:hypothetical protein
MAARVRSGELTPHELTTRAHRTFGHEHDGERLSESDGAYDVQGVTSDEELDAAVMAEVLRITS